MFNKSPQSSSAAGPIFTPYLRLESDVMDQASWLLPLEWLLIDLMLRCIPCWAFSRGARHLQIEFKWLNPRGYATSCTLPLLSAFRWFAL